MRVSLITGRRIVESLVLHGRGYKRELMPSLAGSSRRSKRHEQVL